MASWRRQADASPAVPKKKKYFYVKERVTIKNVVVTNHYKLINKIL